MSASRSRERLKKRAATSAPRPVPKLGPKALLERLHRRWNVRPAARPNAPRLEATEVRPGGILRATWSDAPAQIVAEFAGKRVRLEAAEGGVRIPEDAVSGRLTLWAVTAGHAVYAGDVLVRDVVCRVLEARREEDGAVALRVEGWSEDGRLVLAGRRYKGEEAGDGWVRFVPESKTARVAALQLGEMPPVRVILPPAAPRRGAPRRLAQ